ncbi:hypothetical protein OSTOST_15805, partial [Ostertagia ostertagi]
VIEGSNIAYEIQLSSVPTTLYLFMGDGGHTKQLVLYGTRDGKLGLVDVKPKDGEIKWEITTTSEGDNLATFLANIVVSEVGAVIHIIHDACEMSRKRLLS